jgi:hypothetical protein
MDGPLLPGFLLNLLAATLVIAVAFGLVRLSLLQYALLAPPDAGAVPILHVVAILAGGLLGLLLLGSLPYADDFRPSRIYAADSPWNVDAGTFLARHAFPETQTLRAAAARLGSGAGEWATLAGQLGFALIAFGALQAVWLWRSWYRLRAGASVLLLAVWTALVLHYLAHSLAWAATQMNFWLFALLLVLWQRWRYRLPRAAH